jgi:hypothetical protein
MDYVKNCIFGKNLDGFRVTRTLFLFLFLTLCRLDKIYKIQFNIVDKFSLKRAFLLRFKDNFKILQGAILFSFLISTRLVYSIGDFSAQVESC